MGIFDDIKTAVGLTRLGGGLASSGYSVWPSTVVGPGAVVSDQQRVSGYNRYTNIYFGRFNYAFPGDPVFSNVSEFATRANVASRSVDALQAAVWVGAPSPHSDDEKMALFASELLENGRVDEALSGNVRDTILSLQRLR